MLTFHRPTHNDLCKLLRFSYGIVEADRPWLCIEKNCVISPYQTERVPVFEQLFVLRPPEKYIVLLAVKVVDDFFLAATTEEIISF